MREPFECSHCGEIYSTDQHPCCPRCGKTGQKIEVSVSDGVGVRDDLRIGTKHGQTGRSAIHSDSRNPSDSALIEHLVQLFLSHQPTSFEDYINKLAANFTTPATFEGAFYRAVSSDIRTKIDGRIIGPSPHSAAGRYNAEGESCLYLIDDLRFLSEEIRAKEMLVQEYRIPLSSLRVANLSAENADIDNSLSLVFQMTERGKTASGFDFEQALVNQGRSKYLLSLSVADAFKRFNWQGLYVPGVHGRAGETYRNLVIIGKSANKYKSWAIGEYRVYVNGLGWTT